MACSISNLETLKQEARWNVSTVCCTGECKFKLQCYANCGFLVPLSFLLPFSHVQIQHVFTPASKKTSCKCTLQLRGKGTVNIQRKDLKEVVYLKGYVFICINAWCEEKQFFKRFSDF